MLEVDTRSQIRRYVKLPAKTSLTARIDDPHAFNYEIVFWLITKDQPLFMQSPPFPQKERNNEHRFFLIQFFIFEVSH